MELLVLSTWMLSLAMLFCTEGVILRELFFFFFNLALQIHRCIYGNTSIHKYILWAYADFLSGLYPSKWTSFSKDLMPHLHGNNWEQSKVLCILQMWSRGFCLFCFLLDKPWGCYAENVWFLHFYLYLIALNRNLQNAFLQQFTCLS